MNPQPALAQHAKLAAPLIRSSGPAAFDHIFTSKNGPNNLEFLENFFASEHTIFTHKLHHVLLDADEVVGTISLSVKKDHDKNFFHTVKSIFTSYGFGAIFRGLLFELRLVKPPKKGRLYIANVAVKTSHQGKGLGARLITYAQTQAEKRGLKILSLDVRVDNHNAIELYKRNGFKQVAYHKSYHKDLQDHIHMEKHL